MKKALLSLLAIGALIACPFAQTPASSQDSLKSSQKIESLGLNKKTIVTPKAPTNWSKIKDLFR
jgi:hypothetical protein